MEPTATEEPKMHPCFRPLVSSQMMAMAWLDPKGADALEDENVDSATLLITFKGSKTYSYKDVPREVAVGLMHADSAGKFFGAHIKGKDAAEPKFLFLQVATAIIPEDATAEDLAKLVAWS